MGDAATDLNLQGVIVLSDNCGLKLVPVLVLADLVLVIAEVEWLLDVLGEPGEADGPDLFPSD